MWARGISIDDLSAAIKNGTSYTGAGQFDSSSGTAILRPQGQLETAEQYSNLIVGGTGSAPVYLRDVADGEGFGAGRAHQHAFLGARLRRAVGHGHRRRLSPGGRQRGRGVEEHPGNLAA